MACDMPLCSHSKERDTHAVRTEEEGKLMEMCDGCLDDGWKMNVTVLD